MSQEKMAGSRNRETKINKLRKAASRMGELTIAAGGAEFLLGSLVATLLKNPEAGAVIALSGLVHIPIGIVSYLAGNEANSSR